jgi:hypothetical protein
LGGRKKYSLASFGLRGGLRDLQECIFLVRCLFSVCRYASFVNGGVNCIKIGRRNINGGANFEKLVGKCVNGGARM